MDDGEGGGSGAGEARIKSRIGNLSKMGRMPRSRLETALESGYMMKEYSEVLALLGKLSPSAADLSLRSLSDTDHGAYQGHGDEDEDVVVVVVVVVVVD